MDITQTVGVEVGQGGMEKSLAVAGHGEHWTSDAGRGENCGTDMTQTLGSGGGVGEVTRMWGQL